MALYPVPFTGTLQCHCAIKEVHKDKPLAILCIIVYETL